MSRYIATNSWKWTVIVLSCFYLLAELIFNYRLVEIMSLPRADKESLNDVEFFGRAISGVGVSLLIADFLIGFLKTKYMASVTLFGISLVTVGPAVYYGQKELVEYLLVDKSTAEQKQTAFHAQIIKQAMASNLLIINNLPYDPNNSDQPENKTFLAIFGGIAFFNQSIVSTVSENTKKLIDNFYHKESIEALNREYPKYKKVKADIKKSYASYQAASKKYYKSLNSVDAELKKAVSEIDSALLDGHGKLLSKTEDFHKKLWNEAGKINSRIYKYLKNRQKCRSSSCTSRLDKKYKKGMRQLGVIPPDPVFWYAEHQSSETANFAGKAAFAIMTGGLSLLLDGVTAVADDDYEWNKTTKYITDDKEHYYKKLVELKQSDFEKASSGYQYVLQQDSHKYQDMPFKDFVEHATTIESVRKKIQSNGIPVSNDWYYRDHAHLGEVLNNKINKGANEKWAAEMKKRDLRGLEPGLNWRDFQRSKQIQKLAKSKMQGVDANADLILFDWNNTDFLRHIIKPTIKAEKNKTMDLIFSPAKTFEEGGDNYQVGRNSIRSTTIPLVSLVLSLILCILTLAKITPKVLSILLADQYGRIGTASRIMVSAIFLVSLAATLIAPLKMDRQDLDNKVIERIFVTLEESSGPVISYIGEYILLVQPLVYKAGEYIVENSRLIL